MTKQEAKSLVESKGAKVLAVRMSYGIPKVTVDWKDYLKVRSLDSNENLAIAIR